MRARRRGARRVAAPLATLPAPTPFPGFVTPCDPTLREQAPSGPEWLHEIKIDGYRAQLQVLMAIPLFPHGYDWTEQFHQIAQAAQALTSHDLQQLTASSRTNIPTVSSIMPGCAPLHDVRPRVTIFVRAHGHGLCCDLPLARAVVHIEARDNRAATATGKKILSFFRVPPSLPSRAL